MIIDSQSIMQIKPCIYYNQIYDQSFSMQIHKHNTLEIMYVYNGLMVLDYIDDSGKKESITITQGQFVLLKPMLAHKISFGKTQSNVLNIEFESRIPAKKIEQLFFVNSVSANFPATIKLLSNLKEPLLFYDTRNFLQTLLTLHEILDSNLSKQQFELLYTLHISQLITDLLLCELQPVYKKSNSYIRKASSFIQQNLHNDISISDIAEVAGCSSVYLERLFKSYYNTTVGKKLNELRIERAKYLLKQSDRLISEIGYSIGFSSPQSFINNFKAFTNTTPKEYKHKIIQKYQHLHAYKQAYFDEKFNRFFQFEKGTMLLGQETDDCLKNANTNCLLYTGKTALTTTQINTLKDNLKFIFADAKPFENREKNLSSFIGKLKKMQIYSLLIGFYVCGDDPDLLFETIIFLQKKLPDKRILLHTQSDNLSPDLLHHVTDIVIKKDQNINDFENLNVWLYLPYTDKEIKETQIILQKTNCEGILFY